MGKSEKKQKLEPRNITIKSIDENPVQKASPIIGYYPMNGSVGPDSVVKAYKQEKTRNPKDPRIQLVVSSSNPQLSFVGTSYSGHATQPQRCNYALGVFDKATGVLKMVPVASNRIFRLVPTIEGSSDVRDEAQAEVVDGEMTKEERFGKLKNLAIYETNKNVRRDKKRDNMRQAEDTGTTKDFDEKLKGIAVKAESLATKSDVPLANDQNVPPYDMDATTPDMAYPLDKIIGKGEWSYLLDVFELVQAGVKATPDHYPSFVRRRIGNLNDIEDESTKKRMAGVLSYITHLIKFKDKHTMDGVSSTKHHKFPNILFRKLSSMFGSTNDRRLPDDKLKLLVNYVLVLSLIVDGFRSDPSDITKDLRMDTQVLREHYAYLGCKLVREKGVTLATLPLPLKFETMKRKRRR